MNSILERINQLYLPIQRHILPSAEDITWATEQTHTVTREEVDEAFATYNRTLDTLREVISQLSPNDIIEAYTHGCRLLRCNLSGYMGEQFNAAYVPLMIASIRAGHVYTAEIFLQLLADQLGRSVASIVIESLDSQETGIRQKALLVTEQLHLVEALPKVQALTRDPVEETALLAKQVIQRLEG